MEFAADIWGIWQLPSLAGLDWAAGPGGAILLLIALALDWLIGDPRWLPHPVRLMGAATAFLDARLNRAKRGAGERIMRGLLAVLAVLALSALAGWAVANFIGALPFGWIAELVLVTLLVAQRGMVSHTVRVIRALKHDGVAGGRKAVAEIVGRETAELDEPGVARAAIESCAESYSDGIIAPIFWYLLLGLPGLMAYKAVNTMDSMIGHMTPQYRAFGMTAARLDDVLNLIPARLAGLFLVFAALFVPTANPPGALRVMLRDARFHRSVNAGWPEGAMAGALGLALAGPRHYSGGTVNDPWIGDGSAKATPKDINRGLYLYVVACLINAMWVAAIAMVRFSL